MSPAIGKPRPNLATATKISDPCGWALDPGRIEPGTPVTVTGVVEWTDGLTEANLTQWVEDNEKATTATLTDPDVISRSYPVQRITGIVAQTPSRIPSGEPVTITIYAKWPSGVDDLNPIYIIPSTGVPSSVFTAIAGSTEQLRLIDNCAGAVAVSSSRTVATALRPAKQCTVLVDLGNFDETATTSFDIVGHGS